MKSYPGSLHNHSDYSNIRLRDSINRIPSLVDYAIELGHECIALTDHECISGFVQAEEYYTKVKETNPNFKLIRGNEIYLVRNGMNASNYSRDSGDGYYHFILLAKDIEGYHQICKISTNAWKRSYKTGKMRRVPTYYSDLEEFVKNNKGHLVASTACLGGQLPKFILRYKDTKDPNYIAKAIEWINYMVDIFGKDDFYLEMQPSNNEEQIYVNQFIIKLSNKLGLKYIITTDSHYLKKEDAFVHSSFLKAEEGEREVSSFYETTYMMGDKEIKSFFNYLTEDELYKAFDAIVEIKDKCQDYTIQKPLRIPCLPWYSHNITFEEQEYYCKLIPSLKYFINSKYKEDNELVKNTIYGIKKHKDLQNQEAYDALEECLNMTWISSEVNNARWSAYYLNLQRIIDECWKAGSIVGPARGSGGGFVLLYCLDIIQMNALRETTKCFSWRLTQRV